MLREEGIWKVVANFSRRLWTSVPKNHVAWLIIQASFMVREEGIWKVVANYSSCCKLESFLLAAVPVGQVMVFL